MPLVTRRELLASAATIPFVANARGAESKSIVVDTHLHCFAGKDDFLPPTSKCTNGTMNRTPQQWGDAVRKAYPGYTGPRPPMQLWHGTADTTVPYSLLQEAVDQWTNVFGLSQTPTSSDTPRPGWKRSSYAGKVEAYTIQGAGHTVPSAGMAAVALTFFGILR